jgi:FAD/FMN-containing dehydrogenase
MRTQKYQGMAVGKDRIERFQASFRGEVIQPADFAYEKTRKIWNASIDKRPGIIAREDTIKAAFGRNYERLMAVKKKYDPANFFSLNQNIKPQA